MKALIYCLLVSLLFVSIHAIAQEESFLQQEDSLLKTIELSYGEEKLEAYRQYSYLLLGNLSDSVSVQKVIELYIEIINEAKKQKDNKFQLYCYGNLISIYFNFSKYNKIEELAPEVLQRFIPEIDFDDYFKIYQLYVMSIMKNNNSAVFPELQKMYNKAKEVNSNEGIITSLQIFYTYYRHQNRMEEAMKISKEAIELHKKTGFLNYYVFRMYFYFCEDNLEHGDINDFLKNFHDCETVLEELDRQSPSIHTLDIELIALKGLYYTNIGDFKQAKICADSLEEYNNITGILIKQTCLYQSIYEGEEQWEKALEMIDKRMDIMQNVIISLPEILKQKANILSKIGRAAETYDNFNMAYQLNDSLKTVEINAKFDELRTQYEVDKLISEKIRNRNYFLFTLAACFLLSVALGIWVYLNRKIAKKNLFLATQIKYLTENQQIIENEMLNKTTFFPIKNVEVKTDDIICPENRKDKLCIEIRDLLLKDKIYRNPSITRDYVTEQLGTNKNSFIDAFQYCFNMSFTDCINKLRLKDAITLLEKSDLPIEEISEKAGFGSLRTFQRQFQIHYNMSPKDYRKSLRSEK